VDVAPRRRGPATSEHAPPVADLGGAADVGWDQAEAAAVVQWHPVRAHDDAGDLPVAGQPPRPCGRDGRAEAHVGGAAAGGRVGQVLDADRDEDLRLVPTQGRQGAGGEGVVAQLHQRIGQLLGPGPLVPGAPAGLHRVQVEPAGDAAVGVPADGEPAALGGVGLRAVLVEPVQVVVHRLHHVGTRSGLGHAGQQGVHHRQLHALLRSRSERLGIGHAADHRRLLTGHRTGGERRGQTRQVLQDASGTHHPGGLGGRQVAVPAQPGGHRLEPVDLRSPGHLGLPHGAGDLGGQPVLRRQQRAQPVQQRRAEQRRQVLGGQGVERGHQRLHDTSHRIDHVFEV
jgi:hypothetical protein